MSSKFTKTSDALLSQLVGHCKNTRAKGPAHVFSQRLIEMSWYAWYHSDLSGGEQPSEPRGTYRRECVTRPGMLSCLFLPDVAHLFIRVQVWGLLGGTSGAALEADTIQALTAGSPAPR